MTDMEKQEKQDLQLIADEVLAGNEDTFDYSLDLVVGKRRFKGAFTFKRPSLYEQARIGVRTSELLTSVDTNGIAHRVQTDTFHENIAFMIATLECVIVKHPKWWDPEKICDSEILFDLYSKFKDWREDFRRPLQDAQESSS